MARHFNFIGTVTETENVRRLMPTFSNDRVLRYEPETTFVSPVMGKVELWSYNLSNYHGHGVYLDESVKLASTLYPHLSYAMMEHGRLAYDYEDKASNFDHTTTNIIAFAKSTYETKLQLTLEDVEKRMMRAVSIIHYLESRYSAKHHLYGIEQELQRYIHCMFIDMPELQNWLINRQIELNAIDHSVFFPGWWEYQCFVLVNNALLAMVNEVLS
jgi:hypothetical protein